MKLNSYKIFLMILVTLLLVATAGPVTAQVYKTVDKDGNVTYTDKPPLEGSQPITLRPISVIEAPMYEQATPAADADEAGEEKPLRYLRKQFQDFTIVSPQHEESIWYADRVIKIAWSAPSALEPGMQVTVSVDGRAQAATSERVIPITGLERGEHTVAAELKDANNRRIATTQTITFFIRQPNLYSNRPGVRPRGGG